MILLIDGYNLLKNGAHSGHISSNARRNFIIRLNNYSKIKNHEVVLVFDGGDMGYPTRETIGKILVVYSGYKSSADHVIKDYILKYKGKDVLVVSSDRELRKYAQEHNLTSISSQDFSFMLSEQYTNKNIEVDKANNAIYKTTDEATPEVDRLMSQVTYVEVPKKDDIIANKKSSVSQKMSKQEKLIIQKN